MTRWDGAKRGTWAIADQLIFAGTNFLLNLLLARWMSAPEYGVFSISFAVYQVFYTFHVATIIEPMLVFGRADRLADNPGIVAGLMKWHGTLATVGLGILLADVSVGTAVPEAARNAIAVAAAIPAILSLWLMRRASYLELTPKRSAQGGFLYLVGVGVGLMLIYRTDAIDNVRAWMILALVASAVAFLLAKQVGIPWSVIVHAKAEREASQKHLGYAKWSAATAILGFVPGGLYFFVLPLFADVRAAGTLRALTLLVMPGLQLSAAIGVLLIPSLSGLGRTQFRRTVRWAMIAAVLGALMNGVLIALWGPKLVAVLFGPGKYPALDWWFWVLGGTPILYAVSTVLAAAIRSRNKPELIFRSAGGATTAVVACVFLVAKWHVGGAIVGTACGYAVSMIWNWRSFKGKVVSVLATKALAKT